MLDKYIFYIEIAGFVTGLGGVYLTVRQNLLCFPIGLASLLCTWILMRYEGYFANAMLQFFFAVFLISGWYSWAKNKEGQILVSVLSYASRTIVAVTCIALSVALGYYLNSQPGSRSAYLDGTTTALSIAAQFLIIRKKIENWYLWILANTIYVIMYLLSGLYIYAFLYAVYLVLAVSGLKSWRASLKTEHL